MRRPRPSRGAAALAAAGCAALTAAAPALANEAGSVTHAAGAVSATLQWERADYGIANPQLWVVRDGVRYDITIADVCEEGCIVVPDDRDTAPGESAVKVADLDGDGEPEVLVDTFSGGAHCCLTTRVLTWNGAGYSPLDVAWRDVGYRLDDPDGDGRPELVGYDPVFASAFTASADSAFPPLILQVDHGREVNVTRRFPALVKADAREKLTTLRNARRGDDVRGILAAYVADQELLGRGSAGVREVDRQRRLRRVSAGFKRLLLRRLRAWGYR